MRKKGLVILLLVLASLSLVGFSGFSKASISLRHKDKKVIDLSKAIEMTWPSGDKGEQTDTSATDEAAYAEEKTELPPEDIKIKISGKRILVDNLVCKNTEEVRQALVKKCIPEIKFELIDDYAESHVYKDVLAVVEELRTELGVEVVFLQE